MELTVLGKYGPYPKAGGACSGYLLQTGGLRLLLDCGSGVLGRLQQACPIGALDAIVLTHLHSDHMADMLVLRYAMPLLKSRELIKGRLPVFLPATPKETADLISAVAEFDARIVSGGDSATVGEAKLTFFPVRHPVECNAVKVEHEGRTFVFSGDLNTTPGFVKFAEGADLLLIDAGFLHAAWNANVPHLSAKLAAELAAEAGVKRLLLTHLSPLSAEADVLAEASGAYPAVMLAQEGERYRL